MRRAAGLAYREAGPADGPVVLCVHGFPESSYMWRDLLETLGEAGWRTIAPDLSGYGDSEPDPPATWERHIEALARFHKELGLGAVVLVVHDWGGLIGLRWACDAPQSVRALVISSTGFFSDGRWHGFAKVLRTPGEGEQAVAHLSRDLLAMTLRHSSPSMPDAAIDEYAKGLEGDARRAGALELYRSGDFEKLAPYEGKLAGLDVPALVLWGADDEFAPVGGAHRFHKRIAGSELVILPDTGHFCFEDEAVRCGAAVLDFLERRVGG